jgi:hypothetical protein
MTETLALAAAIFSAIATVFAALATWRAPLAAAQLAEKLRQSNDRESEKKRYKLLVFANLMQERASIWSDVAVRSLNHIDIIFSDSREVRDAWSDLYNALTANLPLHVIRDRLTKLLTTMARDIGIADQLRPDDFNRIYYPDAIAKDHLIQMARRDQAYAEIQRQSSAQNGPWPPAPQ